ncbi:MAG: hypothetical protein HUJ53_01725 [Holdemanella sp.]|nr:hypothetical protein [Holdemanella sp.]
MKQLFKKTLLVICSFFMVFTLSLPVQASGRKIISKSIYDTMTLWSAYTYNYYFTAHAVLTYNDSNSITQISDLSFSNIGYTASQPSLTANFIPSQKSKYYSGSYATYVVTLTRSVYGYYTDRVDYTLTYSVYDSGSPYSIGNPDEEMMLVNVEVGEPYDINYISSPPNETE